jgi:hypothetical protein
MKNRHGLMQFLLVSAIVALFLCSLLGVISISAAYRDQVATWHLLTDKGNHALAIEMKPGYPLDDHMEAFTWRLLCRKALQAILLCLGSGAMATWMALASWEWWKIRKTHQAEGK